MKVRKVVAGSVLAAGLGAAGMIGAGTAFAAPGVSFDGGAGDPIGIGDNTATGAQASATDGNRALAVSLIGPSSATAGGSSTGNTAVTLLGGVTTITGNAQDNNVVTVVGASTVAGNAKGNTVLNSGSLVTVTGDGASSATSVSLCGTSFSGQAAHVTVNPVPGGVC